MIQYPNIGHLIDSLPVWASWRIRKYFKPEAHLLIEKFLSFKKESSRGLFIRNMLQHSRARYKVSIIFIPLNFRGTLQALNHYFISF
jgi:hypothetical protein